MGTVCSLVDYVQYALTCSSLCAVCSVHCTAVACVQCVVYITLQWHECSAHCTVQCALPWWGNCRRAIIRHLEGGLKYCSLQCSDE